MHWDYLLCYQFQIYFCGILGYENFFYTNILEELATCIISVDLYFDYGDSKS